MPTTEDFSKIIPELTTSYNNTYIDFNMMPDRGDFKHYSVIDKELKVGFKKDTIELILPIPFDLGVVSQDENKKWMF